MATRALVKFCLSGTLYMYTVHALIVYGDINPGPGLGYICGPLRQAVAALAGPGYHTVVHSMPVNFYIPATAVAANTHGEHLIANDNGPMKTRTTTSTAVATAETSPCAEQVLTAIGTEKSTPRVISTVALFLNCRSI